MHTKQISLVVGCILFAVGFSLAGGAQNANQNKAAPIQNCVNCVTFNPAPPQPQIMVGGDQILDIKDKDGKLMVHIDLDGKVTYGEGYKPEDSAKLFWQKVGETYPEMCVEYEKHVKRP